MKNKEIIFTLEGKLETVEDINKAIAEKTGEPEHWFDEEEGDWPQYIEYKDGKTLVIAYM